MYEGITRGYPKVRAKLSRRLAGFIALMRPFTILGALLAGFGLNYFFAFLSGKPTSFWFSLLVGLVLGFLQAGGQALNQSIEEEIMIDKLNGKTYRPTVEGIISPEESLTFAFCLFLVGVSLAFTLNPIFGWFALIITFFAVTYSAPPFRVKRYFLINNLHQGIARGLMPALYVGSAYGYGYYALLFGLPLMLWVTGAQTTKDFADVKGDKAFNIQTLPVKLGFKKALVVMAAFMLSGFALLNYLIAISVFPLKFLVLNALILPSLFIIYALGQGMVIKQFENNAAWVTFYATLGLFYLLPPILI